MRWNSLKFQRLRIGNVVSPVSLYTPDHTTEIEVKETIRDLGILVDSNMRYMNQLHKAVSKTNMKAAWILRTFSSREIQFMRKLWKSLLQCHMDYCNILWAPIGRIGDLRYQESPLRAYTKRCKGL